MRQLMRSRNSLPRRLAARQTFCLSLLSLAAIVFLAGVALAGPFPSDPVEDLRLALETRIQDATNAEELSFRKDSLQKRAKELRTLSDLSRALLLKEWQDDSDNEKLREIDAVVRDDLVKRFEDSARKVLQHGDTGSRVALANLVSENALANMRQELRSGLLRGHALELVPSFLAVMESKQAAPEARAAAAQALGRIEAASQVLAPILARLAKDKGPLSEQARKELAKIQAASPQIVPALERMLTRGEAEQRRAAADALSESVRLILQPERDEKKDLPQLSGDESRSQKIKVGSALVAALGPGLSDKGDSQVRRLSVQAIRPVAFALIDLVGEPRSAISFPPPGRKWTRDEQIDIGNYRQGVAREREELQPLLVALRDQTPRLAQAVHDPDPAVRLLARTTLEYLGNVRQRLLQREESIPRMDKGPEGEPVKLPDDPLLDGFQKSKVVSSLAAGLMDRDARARLLTIDALEYLGDLAKPAAPALVRSLADPDRFVRWAAARTLGKMAPAEAEAAVPALAGLLTDSYLDMRLAAFTALGRYGPAAKAAVPALGRAVNAGDPESRRAALRALQQVGTDAAPAIPDITRALSHPDPQVRQTAAEVLGRFGPAAREAMPALRKVLDDSDPNVRKAASDALLNVTPSSK